MCACVCACVHVCMSTVSARRHLFDSYHGSVDENLYVCVCACKCVRACVRACMCVWVHLVPGGISSTTIMAVLTRTCTRACEFVCLCVCACVCVHACMRACVCVWVCVHACMRPFSVYIHTYMHACILISRQYRENHVRVCVHMYIWADVYVYSYTHIHTCIHTYIHEPTYIRVCLAMWHYIHTLYKRHMHPHTNAYTWMNACMHTYTLFPLLQSESFYWSNKQKVPFWAKNWTSYAVFGTFGCAQPPNNSQRRRG